MAKEYNSFNVEKSLLPMFEACEDEFRLHHPELNGVVLTKSKILYEIMKFYLPKNVRDKFNHEIFK